MRRAPGHRRGLRPHAANAASDSSPHRCTPPEARHQVPGSGRAGSRLRRRVADLLRRPNELRPSSQGRHLDLRTGTQESAR
ncbi:hypothetical protein ACFFX0_25955 [Citricoccus parietis]|uniref:Uncharacterized protein n=1 Tax=Citricoccus parietis TaxID=592307 RepID=A0ABV5G673_9MICC